MPVLPNTEIKAIVKLLKSSDEDTLRLLKEQFTKFEQKILNEIRNEIKYSYPELENVFTDIVLSSKRETLKTDFKTWALSPECDLEDGIFLIASFANPFLEKEKYCSLINLWATELSKNLKTIKLKSDITSIINEVNHFLFMEVGFKGNKEDYYDPENSFIDKVIDKKTGNPILLSTIYLLVTKRLNLPFKGVNIPAHFLLQYTDNIDPIFIDPFNQGEIITKAVCKERIKALKLAWQEEYLFSPNPKQMVTRMLQNLINIYHNNEELNLKKYLESYSNIIKKTNLN